MDVQDPIVLRSLATISVALKDTAELTVDFMSTAHRREALLQVTSASSQLESLRLRLMAASRDVAAADGARGIATWLAYQTRTDRSDNARSERLAHSHDGNWTVVARALSDGSLNLAQAEVIARGLDNLPDDLPRDILARAEDHLVEAAATFGPRELRALARRVLDVIAPELGEEEERKGLEREEAKARRTTCLRTRRRGDGTTEIYARVPDGVASRLLTYLDAFTAPRQGSTRNGAGVSKDERLSHDQKLGRAFCSMLEAVDPRRMPLHGGDATTVIVIIDFASLRDGLGVAALGSEEVISASEARRMACNASIIPAVLGGRSEILDLGRKRRLFTHPQRKAMAVRDRHCRAQGCEIPAAWCEAHHYRTPWSQGGTTNLTDGKLFCNFHHQRAHDPAYHHAELPRGDVRFSRRR